MRQTAARLNRVWLTLTGVVLLLAGALAALIGLAVLPRDVVPGRRLPSASDQLAGAGAGAVLGTTWVVVVLSAVGVVLALLALGWLVAQVPRARQAKPFRLHDDPDDGLTRCSASVLSDAVADQVRALPGVHRASAVLRGTADSPDLTLEVTAGDRTDLPQLLTLLQDRVAADLGDSLDTTVRRLGVRLDVDLSPSRTDEITVPTAGSRPLSVR